MHVGIGVSQAGRTRALTVFPSPLRMYVCWLVAWSVLVVVVWRRRVYKLVHPTLDCPANEFFLLYLCKVVRAPYGGAVSGRRAYDQP